MGQPVIRLATLDDIPAVAHVLGQAFAPLRAQYTPRAYAATVPTVAQLQARWDEGPVWVALPEGQIVGTVSAVVRDGLYIRSMAVLPSTRRHGIGLRLLETIETHAESHRITRLHLATTPFLHSAIRLYERFGFVNIGPVPDGLEGTPLVAMEKRG